LTSAPAARYLVTGAYGCLGAWTISHLVSDGMPVVAFDLGEDDVRLENLVDSSKLDTIPRVRGDITSLEQLEAAVDAHDITHVIHLAALQVPFCRENPPLGAAVNVVGTMNVFELAKRRRGRMGPIVYASSAAVYAASDDSGAAPESGSSSPETHYGVFKVANEGAARIYWAEERVASVGLRPYVVYGAGRDQGMTSAPTLAMRAAATGEPFHIPFGGRCQFNFASDVAHALIAASRSNYRGALTANLPAPVVEMSEIVTAITDVVPDAKISFDDVQLPFPAELEAVALERAVGSLNLTPLRDGVYQTIEHYKAQTVHS
jgi:nucleoside-diphosphate-sugar epimerase